MSNFHHVEFGTHFTPDQLNSISNALEKGQRLEYAEGKFFTKKASWWRFEFGPVSNAAYKALEALPSMSRVDWAGSAFKDDYSQRNIKILSADRFAKLQKIFGKTFFSQGISGHYQMGFADAKQVAQSEGQKLLNSKIAEEKFGLKEMLDSPGEFPKEEISGETALKLLGRLGGSDQVEKDIARREYILSKMLHGKCDSTNEEAKKEAVDKKTTALNQYLKNSGVVDEKRREQMILLSTQGAIEGVLAPLNADKNEWGELLKLLNNTDPRFKPIVQTARQQIEYGLDKDEDEIVITHKMFLEVQMQLNPEDRDSTIPLKESEVTVEIRIKKNQPQNEEISFTRVARRGPYVDSKVTSPTPLGFIG